MEFLKDVELLSPDGTTINGGRLLRRKELIMLFYTASWCNQNAPILKRLKHIYDVARKKKLQAEVIYVSFDDDKKAMLEDYKRNHGVWWAIPFGSVAIELLRITHGITAIPYIVVVQNDGKIITRQGKNELEELGINVLCTWAIPPPHLDTAVLEPYMENGHENALLADIKTKAYPGQKKEDE